jgi:N-acetylneuraminic acid mutarotase
MCALTVTFTLGDVDFERRAPAMSLAPIVTATRAGAATAVDGGSVRRARRLGVAAIGVAGLVAGTLAQPAHAGTSDTPGHWRLLPAAPIALAGVSTGVWTGREVLLGVGNVGVRLAAAYNPTTNTWRQLPGGPGPPTGLEGHDHSVWTGKEWIITGWGPRIAYKPATNAWRKLPTAPFTMPGPVVVWTGSQMIEWGGGCCGDFIGHGDAYRPSTNAWRKLPASPLVGRQAAAGVWTGKEMVIVGGFAEDPDTGSITFRDAAAYNPVTRTWRRLPPMPAARRDAKAVWDGRDVLVVGGRRPADPVGSIPAVVGEKTAGARSEVLPRGVFAYRPSTNRWRLLRPMPRGRVGHAAVWTGTRVIVWGGIVERAGASFTPRTTLSFDPFRNVWTTLAPSPVPGRTDPTAVWTRREMIVAGGLPPGSDPMAAALTP